MKNFVLGDRVRLSSVDAPGKVVGFGWLLRGEYSDPCVMVELDEGGYLSSSHYVKTVPILPEYLEKTDV
jgi:hypothetical protein